MAVILHFFARELSCKEVQNYWQTNSACSIIGLMFLLILTILERKKVVVVSTLCTSLPLKSTSQNVSTFLAVKFVTFFSQNYRCERFGVMEELFLAKEMMGEREFIRCLAECTIDTQDQERVRLLLLSLLRSKSADFFGVFLQHLRSSSKSTLRLSRREFIVGSGENILMRATSSTDHFHKLMEFCDAEDLQLLLRQRDRHGFDCLFHACRYDNIKIVSFLLSNFEYDLSAVDEDGANVIINLVFQGNLQVLQYLFDHRKPDAIAASKIITEESSSFLRTICFIGCQKLLSFFMKRQGNEAPLLSQIFPFPEYAKHLIDCMHSVWFLTETKAKVVAKCLVAYICDKITDENLPLNDCFIRGSNGETFLMVATICTDTLQKLLHLADAQNVSSELLAETDIFGNSILRWACLYGNLDSIKLLITQYKLDWRTDVDNGGASLIHELCMWGNFEVEIPRNVFYPSFFFDKKARVNF